jgi:hypothetical protein
MSHRASPRFWHSYRQLSDDVQNLADKSYDLLQHDSRHPSLHFKRVGPFWSVRVGLHHRALAVEEGADLVWVWIGTHEEYERLIRTGRG